MTVKDVTGQERIASYVAGNCTLRFGRIGAGSADVLAIKAESNICFAWLIAVRFPASAKVAETS